MDTINKIEFFEELKLYYDKLINSPNDVSTVNTRSEAHVISHVLDELKWREIPDKQKQAKRKALISLSHKWASDESTQLDFTYEQAIVDYYDCAENLLFSLSKDTKDDNLKRLYAMVYIEQYFINEYSRSAKLRHTDYNIYTSLLKSLADNDLYKWLLIGSLLGKFETMYDYYQNKA